MHKKTLLSLAVASSVALTGCFEDANENSNAGSRAEIQDSEFEGKTWPVFNPVTSELPLPNDLIFDSEAGDGSFDVSIPPGEENNPVLNALNDLSGASTVAPAVIQFNGKIDETTVDSQAFLPPSDPMNPTSGPIPNPSQNVFLLETEYPSEEPVRGLSAQEPPTLPVALTAQLANGATLTSAEEEAVADLIGEPATQANAQVYLGGPNGIANVPRYDHDVVELDGASALRIRPNQPLDPLKRYIVVVTDSVKDENGAPISASPSYSELTDDDGESLGSALNSVRSLVNNLWEASATNYFALNNSSRESAELDPITADDIALTYSFTTSADEEVLSYIAEPANWFADQVERSIKTQAASGAVNAGASDFSAAREAVNQAVANFKPSEDLNNAGLAPCDSDADESTPGFQTNLGNGPITVPDQFQCVGLAVKGSLQGNSVSFPVPSARDFEINSTNDALAVSAPLSELVSQGDINVHQGNINLPYYLGVPDSESGAPIRNSSWTPDSALAATISEAANLPIPQADPDNSSVLNYNFPFPEKQADIDVPLLAITPGSVSPAQLTNGDGDMTAIIYQHGITTDRSAALAFGSKLVQQHNSAPFNDDQVVVFAIDQPLHGVAPVSREEKEGLAEQLLKGASLLPENEQDAAELIQTVVDREFPEQTLTAIALGLEPFASAPDTPCEPAEFNGMPDGQGGTISGKRTFDEAVANVLSVQGNTTPQCDVSNPGFPPDAPVAEGLGNALSLDNTVANAGSTIPGLAPASTEDGVNSDGTTPRHFGYTANAQSQPVEMDFSEDSASGESGSLFINLTNFLNGRDNLRQGALDLINLRKTIEGLSGVDNDSVYFVGHSLGTQTGGVFAGAVKQSASDAGGDAALPGLKLAGVHLQTPVAGVVRLLENSPSFAPTILGGLQASAGLTQGDADLETFLNVNQHALDSADPINFASELANSNTLISQVNGDRTTPNAADDRFKENIKGVPGYEGGPLRDITIGNLTVNSFEAPLTGSEALANVMGADNTGTAPSSQATPAITRYLEGTHGTPVLPQAESVDAGGVKKDRTIAQSETEVVSDGNAQLVFGELVSQTLQMVTGQPAITGGQADGGNGATVIQTD